MSSAEEDDDLQRGDGANAKKRRVQRACDVCRRKKGECWFFLYLERGRSRFGPRIPVRCDGATRAGNRCSNCIAFNFDCTSVALTCRMATLFTAPVDMSKRPRSVGPLKGINSRPHVEIHY